MSGANKQAKSLQLRALLRRLTEKREREREHSKIIKGPATKRIIATTTESEKERERVNE